MPSGAEAERGWEGTKRVAAIVTTGDPATIRAMAATCGAAGGSGAAVAVLFRDESIPAICTATSVPQVVRALAALADRGVRLYACSTSLYLWGKSSRDLIPAISGVRGLVAFLAEDLPGASPVLTY